MSDESTPIYDGLLEKTIAEERAADESAEFYRMKQNLIAGAEALLMEEAGES